MRLPATARIRQSLALLALVGSAAMALLLATPMRATATERAPEADLIAYHETRIATVRAAIEANGYDWVAGPTSLTAYTPEELKRMKGLQFTEADLRRLHQVTTVPFAVRDDLPESFDWRNLGGTTPAKNQGACGSCWAFAACSALEAIVKIHTGEELDLSEQEILSCAAFGWGCDGGNSAIGWELFRQAGAMLEECMPYAATDNLPCDIDGCLPVATTGTWIDIPNDVDVIKTAIYEYGPVKTTFHAYEDLHYYQGGCYEHAGDELPNHAVIIVGWNDELCDGEGAWMIKNSWGTGWGANGFGNIKYGTCHIGLGTELLYYAPGTAMECTAVVVDDDVTGDGDGWFDPGEAGDLRVTIRNGVMAETRTGIAAELSCTTSGVVLTNDQATSPDLTWGAAAELEPPFAVAVGPEVEIGTEVEFILSVTADGGYALADSFTLIVGDLPVLFVDDDQGTTVDAPAREAFLLAGCPYRTWDTRAWGSPPIEVLQRYPAVVWLTGIVGSFNEAERAALTTYLTSGGALLASGQDIGWWLNESGHGEDRTWYHNTMHASFLMDDSGQRSLFGVDGDPISDGMAFEIGGGSGSCAQAYPSEIAPRGSAVTIFYYDVNDAAAVRWENTYRLVYYAFGLEAANTADARGQLVLRALAWLIPEHFDIQPPEITVTTPNGGEVWWGNTEVELTWQASDNVAVTGVDLVLSRDAGQSFADTLATDLANSGTFTWMVGGAGSPDCLIKATARDGSGFSASDISDGTFTILDYAHRPEEPAEPLAFFFQAGSPNPFVATTTIRLALPQGETVDLAIHDPAGRRVRTLVRGELAPGFHTLRWDGRDGGGRDLAGGIYFVNLGRAGGAGVRGRLLLLR